MIISFAQSKLNAFCQSQLIQRGSCWCHCTPSHSRIVTVQASTLVGTGNGYLVVDYPNGPMDTGYSYSNSEIVNAAAGLTNAVQIGCEAADRYYSGSYQVDLSGPTGSVWWKREWTVDSRDGWLTWDKRSNSEYGTVYEYTCDDYGSTSTTDTGDPFELNADSYTGHASVTGKTNEAWNATLDVDESTFDYSYDGTYDGNPASVSWECVYSLGSYLSAAGQWSQVTDHLAAVNLGWSGASFTTAISDWASGPLTDSNKQTQSLGDLLDEVSCIDLDFVIGWMRQETDGMIRFLCKPAIRNGTMPYYSPAANVAAMQKNYRTLSDAGATVSGAFIVGMKGMCYTDGASVCLRNEEATDTPCYLDTPSGSIAYEASFAGAGNYFYVNPTDCYYTNCLTKVGDGVNWSKSGWSC